MAQAPQPAAPPVAVQSPAAAKIDPLQLSKQEMRGTCYATWQQPTTFLTASSDAQLRRLKEAGMNWIALRVAWSQEGYNTWEIAPNFATPTDVAIGHVVRQSHALGMKVMLALMVDFADDNRGGAWHYWGQLAPGDKETDADGKPVEAAEGWKQWFASYEKYLLRYARVAQESGADMMCIGNEFVTASKHENQWRDMIAKTRQVFKGPLTYQAMGIGEYRDVKFWDVLDYIGMNGYWTLSSAPNPTAAELEAALVKVRSDLNTWHKSLKEEARKPLLFTEVGYHSADGTAARPWERNSLKALPNPDLQARCFAAFLKVFAEEPSYAGVFWWVECPPGEHAIDDRGAGHPFLDKPAENVLRQFAASAPARQARREAALQAALATNVKPDAKPAPAPPAPSAVPKTAGSQPTTPKPVEAPASKPAASAPAATKP